MQPSLSYLLQALFLISNYPFGSLFSLQDLGHKFTRPCLQCLSAKRLNAILKCEKLFSHLLPTSNPLFTNLNVTCAMQVMLVTHLATYTGELRNTKAQVHPSASTSLLNILQHLKILVIILAFQRSVSKSNDCLVFETFFINELRPGLNVQSDSTRAKVFKQFFQLHSIVVFSLHALFHSFIIFKHFLQFLTYFYTLHIYMLILLTFFNLLENDRRSVETPFFISDFKFQKTLTYKGSIFALFFLRPLKWAYEWRHAICSLG